MKILSPKPEYKSSDEPSEYPTVYPSVYPSEGTSPGDTPARMANKLKLTAFWFGFISFIVLIALGVIGGLYSWKLLDASYPPSISTAESTPAQASDVVAEQSTPEVSSSPTPTPAQSSAAANAQGTPDASPPLTPTPEPTPLPKGAALFTAGQNFFILWLLSAVTILFPAALLYAFALQQVPRLAKDLEKDLKKLGISDSPTLKEVEANIKGMVTRIKSSICDSDATLLEAMTPPKEYTDINAKILAEFEHAYKHYKNNQEGYEDASSLIKERYGVWEFLIPLIFLTLFLLGTIAWAFWPEGTYSFASLYIMPGSSLHSYFSSAVAAMSPALVAVLVAYLFMAYGLVRRYHRSDITPGSFWEVFKRLFVVFLLGLALTALFKADVDPDGGTGGVVAFLVSSGWTIGAILAGIFAGIFPVSALQIITRNAQVWLQKWFKERMDGKDAQEEADFSQSLRPRHDLTLLDDIDQWDVERIEEEGVVGLQGMATANIANLVTWTPFPTTQIVDWVDQAILHMAAGAEPDLSFVKTLRAMGLRGASDLVDATKDPAGKLRVVLAAQTLQGKVSEDPIPAALLAGARAQIKVNEAYQQVSKVNKKEERDDTAGIAAALDEVRAAQCLVDEAHEQVKSGSEKLKDALGAATLLQATFKAASSKVAEVEAALNAMPDNKVTQQLESALKALGQKITAEVNSQAQALVSELDKIAQPFSEIESKSKDFHEKAAAISKEAEKAPTAMPDAVTEAASMLTSLTELAKKVKQRLESESGAADAIEQVDALVKLLGDKGNNKPKALLGAERLNKKERWTDSNNKASTQADAKKLVEIAEQIAAFVQAGKKALVKARAAAAVTSTGPTLTMEILENILSGLEHNPNLRRIYRYLRKATEEVPPVIHGNASNVDWLNDRSWEL